jgi:hypothetical protein
MNNTLPIIILFISKFDGRFTVYHLHALLSSPFSYMPFCPSLMARRLCHKKKKKIKKNKKKNATATAI